jgi:hypothetical protein
MLSARSGSAIVLVAVTLLSGCLPDHFPRRQLRLSGSDRQIAGHWRLRPKSANMMDKYLMRTPEVSRIDLSPDGRCDLRDFVDGEDLHSGAGTWKIEDESDDGSKRKHSVLRIGFPIHGKQGFFSLYFTRRHGKIILWQYHGDPDGREYVEYERI